MKKTDILIVMDRSGSMSGKVDDVIGGYNTFLEDQKKLPGEATLTLIQFDHEYNVVHDRVPIKDVPPLTRETYIPRGSTALMDALGKAIAVESEYIVKTAAMERPESVVCLIITDGQENASREYNRSQIKHLIGEKEKGPWVFTYIGSDINTMADAASFGIMANSVVNNSASGAGLRAAYSAMSQGVVSARVHGTDYQKSGALDMNALYKQAEDQLASD